MAGNFLFVYNLFKSGYIFVARYLYFDIGTLFRSFGDYFYPTLLRGAEYDVEKVSFASHP